MIFMKIYHTVCSHWQLMTVGAKYVYCNKNIIIEKALPIMLVTNILRKAKLLIKNEELNLLHAFCLFCCLLHSAIAICYSYADWKSSFSLNTKALNFGFVALWEAVQTAQELKRWKYLNWNCDLRIFRRHV